MTVAELMEVLSECSPEKEVVVHNVLDEPEDLYEPKRVLENKILWVEESKSTDSWDKKHPGEKREVVGLIIRATIEDFSLNM